MSGLSATHPKRPVPNYHFRKIQKTGQPKNPIKQAGEWISVSEVTTKKSSGLKTVGNLNTVLVMFTYAR
jgi:hypothetical protein